MEEELVRRLEGSPAEFEPALEAARLLCLSDDLTAWEERLALTFRHLSDVRLIQAVADALAHHYLRQGRLGDFERLLLETRYADYLLKGFEAEEDPGPALGLMARHSPKVLAELLSKRPDLLRQGLDAAFREAPEQLPRLLQDLALWRRMPLDGALDLMLQLLGRGTPGSRRATAHAFRLAAEAGADVRALKGPLENQPDGETRLNLTYALALSACQRQDWPLLDELLAAPALREGCLKAFRVAWVEQGVDLPELATRVVQALPESEAIWLEGRRRKRQARPEESVVRAYREPSAALYWLLVGQPERAAAMAPDLSGEARRVAEEVARGEHRAACWTCRCLPRRVSESHQDMLPPEVAGFGLDLKGELQRVGCPECGRPYVYTYEEERDDMDYWETFLLERQKPEADPGLLTHLDPNLRREGAWAMAAEAPPETLARLLSDSHPEVVEEALAVLAPPLAAPVMEPLLALLLRPEKSLRLSALGRLARHLDESRDWVAVEALLPQLEPALQASLVSSLSDPPPDLVAAPALRLLADPDPEVGRLAARALLKHPDLGQLLDRIRELWNQAACSLWRDLAQQGAPVEGLIEEASVRLSADVGSCYAVLQGLLALARKKHSLHPALPALAALLASPSCPYLHQVLDAVGRGLDDPQPSPAAVAALGTAALRRDASRGASSVLAGASRVGHDMEPARECLLALLSGEGSYEREMAARAWALHLLRQQRFRELGQLLDRGIENVPGAVATVLSESGADYSVLRSHLERLDRSDSFYTRDCASRALSHL